MKKWILITNWLICSTLWAVPLNNPHQSHHPLVVRHAAFAEAPKTLDPARAYSSNELQFIAQIYEPPLQYHFFKRPYSLVPLTTVTMPTVTFYNKHWQRLSKDAPVTSVAYSVFDIHLQPGIVYEPHPAFVKKGGRYAYHHLDSKTRASLRQPSDLPKQASREVTAADYVYQIKRLASPKVQSPILGVMNKNIVGLKAYANTILKEYELLESDKKLAYLDLNQHPVEGVKAISRYHFQIIIKGVYPQFKYWLAMPFFAPIPWEVDQFYSQKGMKANNIGFDWHPVGTGPYRLSDNDPNKQMVLTKSATFRGEDFPDKTQAKRRARMPFVDKFIFSLDKESIPRWNKFLQGYYDVSSISNDSFDQAIKIDERGQPDLTPSMKEKGIRLKTTISPAVFYLGFNMLDDIVGGDSKRARLLRQAIAIAVDYEEYISIFMNGRGIAAQGPIPAGIFGYQAGKKGINDVVYYWDGNKAKRKPLADAKKLLKKAGYPGGIDPKTKKPLILNYDVAATGGPDDKARLNWFRKQFKKLGIVLNIRVTQYNRFQDKVRRGNAQIFSWGWMADYPDPENFLFLLYGPNGKVKHGGENATNYNNKTVNQLFAQIRNMPDGKQRQQKINALLKQVRQDSPWLWGMHPVNFTLSHQWNAQLPTNAMANNTLKYQRTNSSVRKKLRQQWNQPLLWPLWLVLVIAFFVFFMIAIAVYHRKKKATIIREKF